MKMHGYISEWGIDSSKRGKMLYRTVKQMIAYFYASFRNTSRTKLAKSVDAQISVSRVEVDWSVGPYSQCTVRLLIML
ncbi:hypothetical protein ARMGADRAFT_21093 [Armillaria gallica]|uniref:Uncharacterized protein n=1 Tax=Armillaria gallica TaxID=47427 RepID=A0A2H3EJS2_ARMGA|nr:hypothetical protein ARMGADRAFT_21093 [Armillaria gallica]